MRDLSATSSLQPDAALAAEAGAEGRRVVVVLGSGRSGTSLCANILGRLGIRMDDTLQRPNKMNSEGYFQDGTLHELNRRILDKISSVAGFGPRSDYPPALIGAEVRELQDHLSARTFAEPSPWGLKDLRTSLLLPIYRCAFQALGIVPRYIFCARAPGAVVQSLHEATGYPIEFCEQVYFVRSFLALRDSAANCHVIHYERLLERPTEQIESLWRYVAEESSPMPLGADACVELVDPGLNRSGLRANPLSNPLALRIGALLDSMEGSAFDRAVVHAELSEIDAVHVGYQLWLDRAVKASELNAKTTEAPIEALSAKLAPQRGSAAPSVVPDRPDDPASDRGGRLVDQIDRIQGVLEEAHVVAETRADEVSDHVATLQAEVIALRRQVDAFAMEDSASREARVDQEQLTRSRDEVLAHGMRQEACVVALTAELGALQAEAAQLREERNAAVARARSEASAFAGAKSQLERDHRVATEAGAKAQKRQHRMEEGLESLRSEHETLRADYETLRADYEKLRSEHEKLRAHHKKARAKIERAKEDEERRAAFGAAGQGEGDERRVDAQQRTAAVSPPRDVPRAPSVASASVASLKFPGSPGNGRGVLARALQGARRSSRALPGLLARMLGGGKPRSHGK